MVVKNVDREVQAWLIIAAGTVAALHVGKLPPALHILQTQLHLSLLQSGFLLSAVQGSGMLLGLLIGQWVDGQGLRRCMIGGLMLLTVASTMGGATSWWSELTIWGLLLTRLLEGVGFLLTVLPGPALLRRTIDPHRLTPFLGYWGTYMPTGMSLALLAGPLWLQHANWPSWWWFFSLVSAFTAWALHRWIAPDPVPTPVAAGVVMWTRLRSTLHAKGPWTIALMFGVYSSQWLAVVGFLPSIYAAAGVQGTALALLTTLASAANIVGNILSGRLLRRGWSERMTLWSGYGAMALGSWLAFDEHTAQWPALRFAGILLFSALGGLVPGTLFTLAVRLAPGPHLVGSTVGWMQQISAAGQFMGPPLAAALAMAVGGWQMTWCFTVLCCLAGAALTVLASRLLKRQ
jgi:MFS family permease